MEKNETNQQQFPPQHQARMPGIEKEMIPLPLCKGEWYRGSGKLENKIAVITGGDSGIGRAVAVFFAREGADVAVIYYDEDEDARETKKMVETEGRHCLLIAGDIGKSSFCKQAVTRTIHEFNTVNIVVNNAAHQPFQDNLDDLTDEQILKTFKTNVFSYFYITRACLKYLKKGDAVINTTSVTAYRGSSHLLDYTASKSAEVGFTRALARMLAPRGIRVNGVAPGPIWTPLTPSTYPPEYMTTFGQATLMRRAGHPEEVAPCYVFLAARDSSYMTGTILHPDGGEIVNE